ncbi:MAG: penicillin acylase family protein [Myxococcota bacterium]
MSRRRGAVGLAAGIAVAAVALVLAAGTFRGWLVDRAAARAERPLYEGRLEVVGTQAAVEVWRDGEGWPRILATSDSDAWFGLGFVHAQDRLDQMLWLRRLAHGRAAARIGEAGLAADRLARTLDFTGLAREAVDHLGDDERGLLEAYARGVNARLARLRAERRQGGRPPARDLSAWSALDSLAIYKLVSWSSAQSADLAIVLSDFIEVLGGVGARPFFPSRGAASGVELPVDWPAAMAARAPAGDDGALRPALLDVARLDGSGWVVPPSDARPAASLAAELTFAASAPALVHPSFVSGGELAVAGASIPGLPIFWCGRSERVAWAVAPSRAVATDLFLESLHRDASERYHDGSRWTPLDERVESIEVRGADPVPLRIRRTHHGPLLDDLLGPEREAYAVSWTGARPGTGPGSLLALPRAETAEEVELALGHHRDPSIAVAYADRDGVRGARVVGWLPQRILPSSGVPVPGRMRAFNWYEPVPFDRLPARRADGRAARDAPPILVADEVLPDGRGSSRVEWLWRRGLRAERLGERFDAHAADASGDAEAWLHDSLQARTREVVEAVRELAPRGPGLGTGPAEMLGLLLEWNGSFDAGSAGAIVYRTLLHHLVSELFEPVLGPELLARYRRLPGADPELVAAAVLLASARGDARDSWADRRRVVPALSRALREAWVAIRFELGPNRARWRWGRLHRLSFAAFERPDGPPLSFESLARPVEIGGSRHTLLRTESAPGRFEVQRISGFQMWADLSRGLAEADSFRAVVVPGVPGQASAPGFAGGLQTWRYGSLRAWPEPSELEADRAARRLTLVPAP